MMTDFIEVTNQVIAEQLKGKMHLARIDYSVTDEVYEIRVHYYTLMHRKMGFSFRECSQDLNKDILKMKFEYFIEELKI